MEDAARTEVEELPPGVARYRNVSPEVRANLERLPRLSLGALFAPVIWGPAHGHWLTIALYPIWVWVDDLIMAAVKTPEPLTIVLAVLVTAGTVAVTVFFALTAGPKGYLRVADRVPIDTYLKRERYWAIGGIVFAIAVIALATWFNLTMYDTVHGA